MTAKIVSKAAEEGWVLNPPKERGKGAVVLGTAKVRVKKSPSKGAMFLLLPDVSQRVRLSREGAPAETVDRVAAHLDLSRAKLMALLQLKGSTIERRVAAKQSLTPAETDKLYRVEKVLARATEVLEDEDGAKTWIKSNIRSLGGVSPLSLLDTDAGVDLVMDTLARIEFGVVA